MMKFEHNSIIWDLPLWSFQFEKGISKEIFFGIFKKPLSHNSIWVDEKQINLFQM